MEGRSNQTFFLFHYTKYEFGKGNNIAIDTCFFEGFHVFITPFYWDDGPGITSSDQH